MNIKQYFESKRLVSNSVALLGVEARIFGIPFPLKKGWLHLYGNKEITSDMVGYLRYSLPKLNKGNRVSASIGLGVLSSSQCSAEQIKLRPAVAQAYENKKKIRGKAKITQTTAIPARPNARFVNGESMPHKLIKSDEFLKTFEWRRLRMKVLATCAARCQCCGASPEDGIRIHVDHIKPRKYYPELALDINNLQILCEDCNHGKGNDFMIHWKSI